MENHILPIGMQMLLMQHTQVLEIINRVGYRKTTENEVEYYVFQKH
jgi:hypothetical protein